MDYANPFPSDLTQCHQLLIAAHQQSVELERQAEEARQQVAELNRVLDETSDSYAQLQQELAARLEELAWYKRWVHGRRRERVVEGDGQRHLFDLTPPSDVPAPAPPEARQEIAGHARRRRRELDLSRLPHHRHELDLSAEEKVCDCCGRAKDRIGEDITKILEHVPSKLEVHEHVRPKYACRYCKNGVASPPPPQRPIARGIAGPGLIAQIVVSKFGDHLPLYRQEDIFVRHGLHIARSTLCDWVSAAAEILQPFYELQRRLVVQSAVMWTDDTPVKVLVGGEPGSRQGRFWTYVGDDAHPYSVYDFTMSRGRDGPQNFLHDIEVTCTPTLMPATTRSFSDRKTRLSKWLAGRMRGESSLTPAITIRVNRIRCCSGSGNYTTSKTGRSNCRSQHAVSYAVRNRNRSWTSSKSI